MHRRSLVDIMLELRKVYKHYKSNAYYYLKQIKNLMDKYDESSKIILFGSFIKGKDRVDSDIDVLIITDLAKDHCFRARLRAEIKDLIGAINPFEFHIVSKEEYDMHYKNMIDKYKEIQ